MNEFFGWAYAVPTAESAAAAQPIWRCERCQRTWADEHVQRGSEALELGLSFGVYNLVEELRSMASAAATDGAAHGKLLARTRMLRRYLGPRHWASVRMVELKVQLLTAALVAPLTLMALRMSYTQAVAELLDASNLFWHWCAWCAMPVVTFFNLFAGPAFQSLLAAAPSSERPELVLRALACVAMVGREDADTEAARRAIEEHAAASACACSVGSSSRGLPAASDLKARGNTSFQRGEAKEALLYYRAALMCAPTEHTILSNLAACHRKLGAHSAALAAARHCIRVAPEAPKGYYHAACALLASGSPEECEEAEAAAKRAVELGPAGDTTTAALLNRIRNRREVQKADSRGTPQPPARAV